MSVTEEEQWPIVTVFMASFRHCVTTTRREPNAGAPTSQWNVVSRGEEKSQMPCASSEKLENRKLDFMVNLNRENTMDELRRLGFKLDTQNQIEVEYRCGHRDVHQPSGDREAYQKRIALIDCGTCERDKQWALNPRCGI